MFNFFRRSEDTKVDLPAQEPVKVEQEHYRVGYNTATNMTTLTLKSDETSMTLGLIPSEVKRLIRMLESTMIEESRK